MGVAMGALGTIVASVSAQVSTAPQLSAAASQADPTATAAPPVPVGSRTAVSPAAALGIGLAATVFPTMMAYGLTGKDTRAEDVALFVGVAAGVIAGPAVGLWSGGRGDLVKPGLILRSVGTVAALGAMGVASATWDDGTQDPGLTTVLAVVGVAGGVTAAASLFHDLAITPSATSQGRHATAGLVVRPDGVLALNVRF